MALNFVLRRGKRSHQSREEDTTLTRPTTTGTAKGASIPSLVRRYRGPGDPQVVAGRGEEIPLIVGTEVHEAVGQAMNYLCHLDENRDHILAKFKIDVRRASATVLVGHPEFVSRFSPDEIASTLRIHNSHHARIEVCADIQRDDGGVIGGEDAGAGKGPAGWVPAGPWCSWWRLGGQSDVTSVAAVRALDSSTMALRVA